MVPKKFDLKTYIGYEETLFGMVEPAMNLSCFERFLYAYNITKWFKEYKECKGSLQSSRNLYKILENEYIVCVGFANLLSDLLDKLHIPNSIYSVTIKDDFGKSSGHSRVQVHLIDEKYNIMVSYVG